MQSTAPRLLIASLLAPLLGSLGCWNDAEPSGTRMVSSLPPRAAVVVGGTARVRVRDTVLTGHEGCNGYRVEEGAVDSRVARAICDGARCTVTPLVTAPGSFDVLVRADEEGEVTVSVDLEASSGELRGTTFRVRFEAVRAIELVQPAAQSPWGTVYASLPGAVHRFCAYALGASGRLVGGDAALTVSGPDARPDEDTARSVAVPGDEVRPRCDLFAPGEAGAYPVAYRAGDVLRNAVLRVVSPDDVVRLELGELDWSLAGGSDFRSGVPLRDVTTDVLTNGGIARVELACRGQEPAYAVRFATSDGTVGLTDVFAGTIAPPDLASLARVQPGSSDPTSPFALFERHRDGAGTYALSLGEAALSVPLDTPTPCPSDHAETEDAGVDASHPNDGSTTDGGDAGAP